MTLYLMRAIIGAPTMDKLEPGEAWCLAGSIDATHEKHPNFPIEDMIKGLLDEVGHDGLKDFARKHYIEAMKKHVDEITKNDL